jgi:hypothetical protein
VPRVAFSRKISRSGSAWPACRARLERSRRRRSPHARTLPRQLARSRSLLSCAGPPIAQRATRFIAPLRPHHGSWERPDYGFADAVQTIVAKGDAPDFEMPAGTGIDTADIGSSRQFASRDAAPAPPPPPTPDDDERARESPLFPVISPLSDRSPSDHPASDGPAASEQKSDTLTLHLTAIQPHTDGLFVLRSAQRSSPKSK